MPLQKNILSSLLARTAAWTRHPTSSFLVQRTYSSQPVDLSFDLYSHDNPTKLPLVTLHGLFGSKQNWRGISRALSKTNPRNIYAIDARNHGESPHTEEHNSSSMSADVRHFLEQRGQPMAACLGHSMGGRTMMYFARENPTMVERLIVVDISPIGLPRSTAQMKLIFDAMLSMNIPNTLSMSEGRKLAKNLLKDLDNETVDFIMLNLRKNSETGEFSWACNAQVLSRFTSRIDEYRNKSDLLPPYTGPTTFICGSRSPYMKEDHWPQILEIFPNAEIHWLDSGHLVHFERPQEFLSIVTEFLNRS
nr:protein ABHD11 [Drosophila bipectinata]